MAADLRRVVAEALPMLVNRRRVAAGAPPRGDSMM
jgi:hypothetical protein